MKLFDFSPMDDGQRTPRAVIGFHRIVSPIDRGFRLVFILPVPFMKRRTFILQEQKDCMCRFDAFWSWWSFKLWTPDGTKKRINRVAYGLEPRPID